MMTLPQYFLLIAAQLAVLTYYIGVLVYMLPIPLRSVKRWAPTLIQDSLWVSILITLYVVLLKFADAIAGLSGYSISDIISYMQIRMKAIILMEYITRLLVGILASIHSIIGKFFSIYMLPMVLVHYGMLTAAATVIVIASIVSTAKAKLTALSIALIAIPFRIGRNAGASLLAFVIVSNIMLPFLPHWITMIYESLATGYLSTYISANESREPIHLWGMVKDAYGHQPLAGLVRFIDVNNGGSFRFVIHEDGGYYVTKPLKMLPSGDYRVEVEYLAHILGASRPTVKVPEDAKLTYELDEAEYRLDITVEEDAIFVEPIGLLIISGCKITKVYQTDNILDVTCEPMSDWIMITISSLGKNDIEMTFPDSAFFEEYRVFELATPWRGVKVYTKILSLKIPNGADKIDMRFAKNIDYYSISSIYKLELSEGVTYPNMTTEDAIVYYIVYGTAFPITVFSYLTIMSMVSINFARVLGASSPRIIFD